MATRLSRLKIDEVSFVTSPANKGARAVIVKRRDDASDLITDAMRFAAIDEIAKERGAVITKEDQVRTPISKADLFGQIQAEAVKAFPNATPEGAVAKYLDTEAGRELYGQYKSAPGASVVQKAKPRDLTGGTIPAVSISGSTSTYSALMALAHADQRKGESIEKAFSRIYADPSNSALVKVYKAEMAGAVRKASA